MLKAPDSVPESKLLQLICDAAFLEQASIYEYGVIMTLTEGSSLLAIMVMLAALPGTSVGLVVAHSVTSGFRSGLAVAMGIVLGDLIFVLLAVLGLSVLAETMGELFALVKYLGGMYLLWLGFTLLRSARVAPSSVGGQRRGGGLVTSFISGLVITLGDMKAIFFYASLFPVFVDLAELRFIDLFFIILITVVGVGGVKTVYAFTASRIAKMPQARRFERAAKTAAGGCLLGAGAYLLVKA